MDSAELNNCRNLIQNDEHLNKFLFSNGFGSLCIDFSCKKTDFSEAGKLHMIIQTTEMNGAGEIKVNVPVEEEPAAGQSVDSKFTHQSTGVIGQYETRRRQVVHVPLSHCLKSLILYCNFQHVIAVQFGRSRNYYIYGPSLQAMVDKMKEDLQAASNRTNLTPDEFEKNFQRKNFLQKVFDAFVKFSEEEIGAMTPLPVLYDEEKYKTSFRPPMKESLVASGRTYDMFCVQGVIVNPATRAVMLDLGIYFQVNKLPKNKQIRLVLLADFCANFGLIGMDTVIHYHSKPNLSSTVMVGPLYYHGTESLESLQAALIGLPCVYVAMEEAQQTNFSIKVESVTSLLLEMDKAKQGTQVFREPRDPVEIAATLYNDIRSAANLHQREVIMTQEEMIRRRMAEYTR